VGLGTVAVLVGLLVGKPIGILLLTYAPRIVGLRPPAGLRVVDVAVLGMAAGIGFTVSLFFSTAAFTDPFLLAQTKMGALLSFFAAPLAIGAGRLVGLSPRTAIKQ
jgi:NhaA family Na+:H+ antiporter